MKKKSSLIQNFAWIYALVFFLVVLVGYITSFNSNDLLFGLFAIDPIDDGLHLLSALWAALAAWHSFRQSVIYFKIFGILYCLDGVMGIIFGNGYLDFAIFLHGIRALDLGTKIAINIPHIAIGGLAIIIGFVLSKKFKAK